MESTVVECNTTERGDVVCIHNEAESICNDSNSIVENIIISICDKNYINNYYYGNNDNNNTLDKDNSNQNNDNNNGHNDNNND